jgi:hypothetical protein
MSKFYGAELPDDMRDVAAKLLPLLRDIGLDADGFPCNPSQEFEIWSATGQANRLTAVMRSPSGTAPDDIRWIADEFTTLVIATKGGRRTAVIGRRWLALRERATAAYWATFGPADVPVPDTVPADMIGSLRDSTNPDGLPAPALDPDDVVSEGEDIVAVEGGYTWHTDGRPPEPVQG